MPIIISPKEVSKPLLSFQRPLDIAVAISICEASVIFGISQSHTTALHQIQCVCGLFYD